MRVLMIATLALAASGAQALAQDSAANASAAGGASSEAAGASADFTSGPLKVDDMVVVSPDAMPAVPYNAQKPNP